jgi:uncharacterized protein YdeI (YjbR/CyaY-like superfamily)
LSANHKKSDGVWVKIARANSGIPSVTHAEALDSALCYGWIDGLRRGFDSEYFLQKFTPRRGKSIWSLINKKKVTALIKEGRMKAAGLAAIEVAKNNGLWSKAYKSQSTATLPAELKEAFKTHPDAKRFFNTLNSQNRYAIIFRINNAKKTETKLKKVSEFIAMLERKEKIYP